MLNELGRSPVEVQSPAVLTAIGPLPLRSSGAHCDPELAKKIGEKLGEEDWREAWRRGLARRRKRRKRSKSVRRRAGGVNYTLHLPFCNAFLLKKKNREHIMHARNYRGIMCFAYGLTMYCPYTTYRVPVSNPTDPRRGG